MEKSLIKRILYCLMLCTCMVFHYTNVHAQDVYTEESLLYVIEDESITIVGYFGNSESVTVPSQIAGLPVSAIAADSFINTTVKELVLPDTIMTIEEGAISPEIIVNYQKDASGPVSEEIPKDVDSQNTQTEVQPGAIQSSQNIQSEENIPVNESSVSALHSGTGGFYPVSESTVNTADNKVGTDAVEVTLDEEKTEEKNNEVTTVKTKPELQESKQKKINPFIIGLIVFIAAVLIAGIFMFINREEEDI